MDINIFVQVGFVVLVGLASKNAILIVEFARDRQQEGASPFDAAVEAATVRLRPIMMTSFAFILGVLPLVIADGAGAEMRRTLGTAVFAGMLGVTLFGIFLTPVFYYVIGWLAAPCAQPARPPCNPTCRGPPTRAPPRTGEPRTRATRAMGNLRRRRQQERGIERPGIGWSAPGTRSGGRKRTASSSRLPCQDRHVPER